MRLVLISDTHCQHDLLDIPPCDILIHAGDWTRKGSEFDTIDFLMWLESQTQAKNKIFISGNHDFYPEEEPEKFKELRNKWAPNATYLEEDSAVIGGYKFYGSPITPWFHSWAFNRVRGDEIRQHWDLIPDDTDVLITHGPALGYGDKLSKYGSEPGARVGCADLLHTIDFRLRQLKLHVYGHIHEGFGTYVHKGITMANAAVLSDRYELKNPAIVFDLP